MAMPEQVQLTPEQIASYFPEMSSYLEQLLGGYYLDQGQNPYIGDLLESIRGDAMRTYEQSTMPLARASLNMSGAYGTALGSLAESAASQDFTRGLMGQMANTRSGLYESERDRMMQGLQLYSGETVASRQGLFGARDTDVQSATNIRQAEISAAAQRAAARMSAGASRYGADRSYAAARLGAQGDYWRNLFNWSQTQRGYQGGPQNTPGQPTGGPPMPGLPFKSGDPQDPGGDPWNNQGLW